MIQNCTGGTVGYAGPGITIGGNFVCVGNPLTCVADDGVVNGNLTVEENLFSSSTIITNSEVLQNTISGNAEIGGNTGPAPLTVGGNTIGGNLQCVGNSQTPDDGGTPNTVSGQKLGQCAGL